VGSPNQSDASGLAVAVVTETYPPEINGVANTMRQLVLGLAARGHRMQLVRPRQEGDRRSSQGAAPVLGVRETLIPGLPIPGYRGLRFGLPVYWTLRRLWGRNRPDVVYIATQGPLGHAALAVARGLGVPTLTGFHTQFHQYSRHYGLGIMTEAIAAVLRRFHNRSNATLAPTAELKDQLSAAGYCNVQVFGRGVDVGLFNPDRRDRALRASWGCGPDDLAVLYVGRIAAEKNLELARRTFEAIEGVHPDARFVLVGDGPELEPLRRDYPRFVCPGSKVGEELSGYYASGDLFLFPSMTETFGNVVPEAMASGLPVVAFDYAAARTYIVSGRNGVTVPIGDPDGFVAAAVAACVDRGVLARLGREARTSAEGMSWDLVLKGVEDRLFEVVRRGGGPERRRETVAPTP
jgi:glycosyltransferase involved in cell wall biosynthesis